MLINQLTSTLSNMLAQMIINPFYHDFACDHQGSNRLVVDGNGNEEQKNEYYPYGGPWGDASTNQGFQPFKYNSKELDRVHGLDWYDYGARRYDPAYCLFTQIDPLAEKYPHLNPYVYCAGNPVNYVDPDGLYPKNVLIYNSHLGINGGYRYTKSASHLLSLVSGVSEKLIQNAVVLERGLGTYRPWYKANKGGGAITIGLKDSYKSITFTENFFEDDPNAYNKNGFGQNVKVWLRLSSHEVGHLPQIDESGGLLPYISSFIGEYINHMGHDNSPKEREAEKGAREFDKFNKFVNSNIGKNALINLFESNLSHQDIIDKIDEWWDLYTDKK